MNPDELSLTENESLEIVGAGDGDGWLLVSTVEQQLGILCFKIESC